MNLSRTYSRKLYFSNPNRISLYAKSGSLIDIINFLDREMEKNLTLILKRINSMVKRIYYSLWKLKKLIIIESNFSQQR